MPLEFLETCAKNAFKRFLILENAGSFEKQTARYCSKNNHPENHYFAAHLISKGFLHLLVNTPYRAGMILNDLACKQEDSVTMTAVRLLSLKYRLTAQEIKSISQAKNAFEFSNLAAIEKKAAFISNASNVNYRMHPNSYEQLDDLSASVDRIKDGTEKELLQIQRNFILQPIVQDMSALLSPLLK